MNKFTLYSVVCAAATLAFTSCSDDNSGKPDKPDDPKGQMTELTPSESKQFLVETSNEFMGKFRAADQRNLIVLASYFDLTYGHLDMPEEFEVEEDESFGNLRNFMNGLRQGMSNASPSRSAAAVTEYVYTLNFERFAGVYEPGRESWKRTSDSKDIIFRFKGDNGQDCELKAVAAGGTSDGTIEVKDEWQRYDYNTGSYEDYEESNKYVISVPKKVTITLTSGSSELLKGTVDSDINLNGHKVDVSTNIVAMNLVIASKISGNDTKVNLDASLNVSNESVLTASATINGKHLCDKDYYLDNPKLTNLFQNGTATVSALNKVRVDAQVTYNSLVEEILDYPWWDSYDYSSKDVAKSKAEDAIEVLNKNMSAEVRFNNKETVQATLIFGLTYDSWGSYNWEYGMEPLLKFASDQSTYSFEEYFEKGFGSVEDTFSDLQRSYEKIWKSVR